MPSTRCQGVVPSILDPMEHLNVNGEFQAVCRERVAWREKSRRMSTARASGAV